MILELVVLFYPYSEPSLDFSKCTKRGTIYFVIVQICTIEKIETTTK
jgi:hypothetical protein